VAERIQLPHNWRPRDYQLPLWRYLEGGGKRAIAIWHRRAGKDEVCLHHAAVSAWQRPATYWHMLPEYAQGRKAIWTAVNPHTGRRRIDEAFPIALRANTNEQEMFIRFRNGATWQVVGSDRYDAAVGSPPYGITFSEWALSNPSAWAYLAPIVLENDGWALFITTSRGRNHAFHMLEMAQRTEGWFHQTLTIEQTHAISTAAVEHQREEYIGIFGEDLANALIEQEYYCSFDAPILGSFWGREMRRAEQEGRINDRVALSPELPIRVAWDIGVDDPMALWVYQVEPGRINVLAYYESSGFGFPHYADWLRDAGYWPIICDVPHDAKVMEAGTGKTRVEAMIGLGMKVRDPLPNHPFMDGVNAGRQALPLAHFHAKRCAKGIECLRNYKHEWDEQNLVFRKTEKHDWSSHGGSAWRYLSLAWQKARPNPEPAAPKPIGKPLAQLTMKEFHELAEADDWRRERI